MKNFNALAFTEAPATVRINTKIMYAKFGCLNGVAKTFVEKHPEYKDCTISHKWDGDDCVIEFLAVSNVVFEEA